MRRIEKFIYSSRSVTGLGCHVVSEVCYIRNKYYHYITIIISMSWVRPDQEILP